MTTPAASAARPATGARKTIDRVDVAGRRVLMRVDFNVPLDAKGSITDDRRIRLALPSIESVLKRGGGLVLMSHLGRPEGRGFEAPYTMAPAAARLGELLTGVAVHFVRGDCVGPEAAAAARRVGAGQVLVLDNLRFHAGEKEGDRDFAGKLAAYGDVYCNEAFGTAHRADASMVAVPEAMRGRPRAAGLLLARELRFLSEAVEQARRPFLAVLGGAKVSDKLGAIRNLLRLVDSVLIGGAMAYTFLKAAGGDVGASRVEETMVQEAGRIAAEAASARKDLRLPEDHVCAVRIAPQAEVKVCTGSIPVGWMGLDIGPQTAARYAERIRRARTVVWNGPVGVFETPPFDAGSRALARAIAEAGEGGAVCIAGGGDTAAAVEAFGLADRFTHVSTGGGASLELLEGKRFRSVELLDPA